MSLSRAMNMTERYQQVYCRISPFCIKTKSTFSNLVCLLKAKRSLSRERSFAAGQLKFCILDSTFYRSKRAVKLVMVEGKPSLIVHRGVSPTFYQLDTLSDTHGFSLIQDRRSKVVSVSCERRLSNTWASFLLGIASLSSVNALGNESLLYNEFFSSNHSSAQSTQVRTLNLFSSTVTDFSRKPLSRESAVQNAAAQLEQTFYDHASEIEKLPVYSEIDYQTARNILNSKWKKTAADPESLENDIDQIARYAASQPEVLSLLKSLHKQPLKIKYHAGEFKSEVKGSPFFVRSVTVHFDPRKAAALLSHEHCVQNSAQCVVSPADALIHELLHAKVALLDSKAFLQSGALNSVIYPYAHEQEVLQLERNIYHSMTIVDRKPRPGRRSHAGQLLDATCVTCLGS